VQAAELLDQLVAGTEVQVVRVAEDDLRAQVAELLRVDGFDRALRADGHEGRRLHVAVRGAQRAGARVAVGGGEGVCAYDGEGTPADA
jgi:hypothetical protein